MKWKCSNNKCTENILTEIKKKSLIERLDKHNYSNITSTTKRQAIRENFKRKLYIIFQQKQIK